MEKIVFIALCVFLAVSCVSGGSEDSGVTVISKENTKMYDDKGLIPDFVEEWDFIKLETSEQSLLHDAFNVNVDDGMIFIFSSPNSVTSGATKQEIKVYDKSGKFLHNIGAFGHGPGEYSYIGKWALNKKEKYVAIHDADKLKKYNYRGEFIEAVDVENDLSMLALFYFLPDDNLLGINWITDVSNEQMLLYDKDFKKKEPLAFTDFKLENSNGGMLSLTDRYGISVFNDHVMVLREFCDTLYVYEEGKLQPRFYFELSRSIPAGFKFKETYDMVALQEEINEIGYHQRRLRRVFETADYYIFLGNNPVIWSKKSDTGMKFGKSKYTSPVPNATIICAEGNTLIGSMDAVSLMEYRERCEEEGMELSAKQKELFAGFDEEDNPVLITYTFKTEKSTSTF